jgi:Flp pilus assembly protein TadG
MTSKSSTTTVLTRLRHWRDDQRAMAAVEFAMVLPFMLTLYIGGVELGDAMAIQVKVTDTAHIVADLVTQQTNPQATPPVTGVTAATVQGLLGASSATIAPYTSSNLAVTVSEVSTDASGAATVTWSQTRNGTALAKGTPVTLPSSLAGQPNISMILGQASYNYTPNLGYTITGTVVLADGYFLFPRNTPTIPCPDC